MTVTLRHGVEDASLCLSHGSLMSLNDITLGERHGMSPFADGLDFEFDHSDCDPRGNLFVDKIERTG